MLLQLYVYLIKLELITRAWAVYSNSVFSNPNLSVDCLLELYAVLNLTLNHSNNFVSKEIKVLFEGANIDAD